jgi:hypothetical protein
VSDEDGALDLSAEVARAADKLDIHWNHRRFGSHPDVTGTLDGRTIFCRTEADSRALVVVAGARLAPALDLGLHVQRSSIAVVPWHPLGEDTIDSEFIVGADEHARVVDLFDEAVKRELVALHARSFDVKLTDQGASISRIQDGAIDAAWIVSALRGAAAMTAHLDEARSKVRPPASLAHLADPLRSFALRQGFSFARTPLAIDATIEGRSLRIASVRAGRKRHHLAARADFEAELGIGLAVRRQGLLDGLRTLLGGQDILVGDAAFDARFLIRADADKAERVAALLDHEARAALLALDGEVGEVAIDDRGITVDPIPPDRDAEKVIRMIDTLAEVTGRVGRNLLHGAGGGAYR